jgi:DNA primase
VLFGLDLAKREIARRHQVVVVEGYTDVMAMHLAGVLTAVASCGTAFGAEHITVLRRLLMDDDAFRGEVIYTFDGDEAGQKAARKAFDEDQKFAAQTFIAIAPDGQDPCELRQAKGDVAVRDLVARRRPLFEFAIKTELAEHNLDNAEGRVEALRRTIPMVSRIKEVALRDEYARQLAGWIGWEDTATVVRRVRETAGGTQPAPARRGRPADPNQGALAVDVDGPGRPNPRDPQLHVQREVIKLALQEPAFAGPLYDSLPQEVFTHPAYAELHRAVLQAGGTASGLAGAELIDAVVKCCVSGTGRSLVTELAVEAIPTRQNAIERYAAGMLAALQRQLLAGQIADIKSRLQRLSPIEEPDEARALWGDLVALEQYYKALGEQAAGGMS